MKDYQLLDDQGHATGVSMFLAAHRGYRRDAARFPAGIRALAERELPADGVEALRNHWHSFDQALLTHHEMEDSFLFPLYRRSHPELTAVLDQLEEQHHDLDERIADIKGWLAKLPGPDAVEPAVAAFQAFEEAVNRHLDLEEQHIVPLMLADPPVPPQFADPDGNGNGAAPPAGPPADLDFAFLAPWLADGLDDDVVSVLLAASPPPFTIGFEESRRRYEEQLRLWAPR